MIARNRIKPVFVNEATSNRKAMYVKVVNNILTINPTVWGFDNAAPPAFFTLD